MVFRVGEGGISASSLSSPESYPFSTYFSAAHPMAVELLSLQAAAAEKTA